jgi:hypothetical protein
MPDEASNSTAARVLEEQILRISARVSLEGSFSILDLPELLRLLSAHLLGNHSRPATSSESTLLNSIVLRSTTV